jgi:hypothetical protein
MVQPAGIQPQQPVSASEVDRRLNLVNLPRPQCTVGAIAAGVDKLGLDHAV